MRRKTNIFISVFFILGVFIPLKDIFGYFAIFLQSSDTKVEPEQKRCCYLVQNWVNLVNKKLIVPVFSIKFVKLGLKLEENNEKYIFAFIQDLIKLNWFILM